MSLVSNLDLLITRLANEFRAIRTAISGSATGGVSGLNTEATNLVGAINEVKAAVDNIDTGAMIDDLNVSTVTTWSSSKIGTEISASVAAVVGAAPDALNTLQEIADALNNDASLAATLNNAIALKADASAVYTKAETDGLLADKVDAADVYTTSDVDALLTSKANVGDSYLKSETHSAAHIDAELALKADASTVYSSSEVDSAINAAITSVESNLGVNEMGVPTYGSTNFVSSFESLLEA